MNRPARRRPGPYRPGLTEGRLWSGAGARALGPGQGGGSTGSRASSVSDAVADSASARAAPQESPCKGRATQGRAQPLPNYRSSGRAGSPLVWGPAQIRPATSEARQAERRIAGQGPSDAGKSRAAAPEWAAAHPGALCNLKALFCFRNTTRDARLGTVVMPGRLDSSLQFLDIKLSVSRSSRHDNRLVLVRGTDQQHRFVRAASDAVESRPAPSRKAHNAKPFKTIQP